MAVTKKDETMLKKLLVFSFILGLLGTISSAKALHIVPQENSQTMVSNICFDTTKYFDEVTKLNKEQGVAVARDRYLEIMSDKNIPCFAGGQIPVILVKMISEAKNLIGADGQCFNSQIWEIKPFMKQESKRKAYVIWHIRCDTSV